MDIGCFGVDKITIDKNDGTNDLIDRSHHQALLAEHGVDTVF